MKTIIRLQEVLMQVTQISEQLFSSDLQTELRAKTDEFTKELEDSRYIKVPLVGVFSAGKSSLLNVFTQKPNMLPVDTLPETAVAYELYYGKDEHVDLFRKGDKIDTKPLGDIRQLKTNPGDVAKVYCDSEPIKALQDRGIVLVDMPGIGSGIERHDAAIFNYIGSGTAFVLIVDVEQGSLRGSTLAFMNELRQYDMCPAVLVSKIDKKPDSEVKDVVDYIRYQMSRLGNNESYISTVCAVDKNLAGLNNYLASIDADALIAVKMGRRLKNIIQSAMQQVKVRSEIRTKDIINVDEKLKQIEQEIANVKVELPKNDEADTPEKSTQDILDNVQKALETKVADIAQMMLDKEDQETIKSFIISVIRSEIYSSLKEESVQYSSALVGRVQDSVENLSRIELDENLMGDLTDFFTLLIDQLATFIPKWGPFLTPLISTLVKMFNWLFGKSDEEILADLQHKIRQKCIVPIVPDLRPVVYNMVIENQKRIQERVQAELVARMENVKAALREKIADTSKAKEEVQRELDMLNEAIKKLGALAESL